VTPGRVGDLGHDRLGCGTRRGGHRTPDRPASGAGLAGDLAVAGLALRRDDRRTAARLPAGGARAGVPLGARRLRGRLDPRAPSRGGADPRTGARAERGVGDGRGGSPAGPASGRDDPRPDAGGGARSSGRSPSCRSRSRSG
jgi:hypothetical protein